MKSVLSELHDELYKNGNDDLSSQNKIDRVRAINYSLLSNYGHGNMFDGPDQKMMLGIMASEFG